MVIIVAVIMGGDDIGGDSSDNGSGGDNSGNNGSGGIGINNGGNSGGSDGDVTNCFSSCGEWRYGGSIVVVVTVVVEVRVDAW